MSTATVSNRFPGSRNCSCRTGESCARHTTAFNEDDIEVIRFGDTTIVKVGYRTISSNGVHDFDLEEVEKLAKLVARPPFFRLARDPRQRPAGSAPRVRATPSSTADRIDWARLPRRAPRNI